MYFFLLYEYMSSLNLQISNEGLQVFNPTFGKVLWTVRKRQDDFILASDLWDFMWSLKYEWFHTWSVSSVISSPIKIRLELDTLITQVANEERRKTDPTHISRSITQQTRIYWTKIQQLSIYQKISPSLY